MDKLTYSIVYCPDEDTGYGADESGINFLCVDNKIHIRLREYNKPEVIVGFINKLTYLLSYLFAGEYAACMTPDNVDAFISSCLESNKDISHLANVLGSCLHEPKYAGLEVLKAYSKKGQCRPCGGFAKGTCPQEVIGDAMKLSSLSYFLAMFNIDIYCFLFNDAYKIVISKVAEETSPYAKYERKAGKRSGGNKFEYLSLW